MTVANGILDASAIATLGGQIATRAKRYPVSGRNGLQVTAQSTNYIQSIRRVFNSGLANVSNVRIRLANWYISTSTGLEVKTGNDIRVAISIESPIGSAPRPLYVNGVADFIIPDGGTVDAVDLSGLVLPANTAFYVHYFARGWVAGAAGGSLPGGRFTVNPGGYGDKIAYNGSATDKTQTIGGETTALAGPFNPFSHFAILGDPIPAAVQLPAFILHGDSIAFGFNEHNAYQSDSQGDVGPWERWLAGVGGYGVVNLGVSGTTAVQWAGLAAGTQYRTLAAMRDIGTHSINALGRNDIANGAAALRTNIDAMVAFDLAIGLMPYVSTVTPYVSSTSDSMATLAGQTTDPTTNPARVTYNDAQRAGVSTGALGLIDINTVFESSLNSGKWPVTGAANYATTDRLHPTAALNALFASTMPAPATYFASTLARL